MSKEAFIQVSDFKLFAKLIGKKNDKPTVVLESGYGDDSKRWNSIVSEIATLTEVLVYDRAGLGKSEGSSNPRTSLEMVKELKELLSKVDITQPFILVGHSFGGVNARLYASIYPDNVGGLLLVDSTPEDYRERFLPTMSDDFQEAYKKQFTLEGNYEEFGESLRQLKECKKKLSVPLIVLSAGKKDHYSDASQKLWNLLQEEIIQTSSNSEWIIAENSAHYIQDDEPSVVIDAIKSLLKNKNLV